jgi:hypothetical protein
MVRPTKLAGLILIGLAVAVYAAWGVWLATRTEVPVSLPITMAIGHIRTPEFKVNLNTTYLIEIEVQKKIPFDTLNCLLGLGMSDTSSALQECPDKPSVLNASWKLTSNGQMVARGSSDDERFGDWGSDSISRQLGRFQSQSGRRYVLDVDVLADGSALAPGNPRLKVQVHPGVYEDDAVWSAILLLVVGVLALIGVILLVISFIQNRRIKASPTPA